MKTTINVSLSSEHADKLSYLAKVSGMTRGAVIEHMLNHVDADIPINLKQLDIAPIQVNDVKLGIYNKRPLTVNEYKSIVVALRSINEYMVQLCKKMEKSAPHQNTLRKSIVKQVLRASESTRRIKDSLEVLFIKEYDEMLLKKVFTLPDESEN